MPRNLDLSALRSFVTVADAGGVTRAAAQLNLTQSAVSMQLKRLEETTGQSLIDRSGRGVALTGQGEQLAGYARRMLALNDEAWGRLTNQAFEGEVAFGVPHDIIHPHAPRAMQRFAAEFPRVRVRLHSTYTANLKEQLARGEMDVILTTEPEIEPGGVSLDRQPLVWVGAPGGQSWRARPLPFASVTRCLFKRPAIDALEAAGMPWELTVDAESFSAVDASVAADLAICVQLESAVPAHCETIRHGGALPDLPAYHVGLYVGSGPRAALAARLAEFVRQAYGLCDRIAAE
ncbi:LysR family transcriptional regulator [Amaricoccus sp.]|uniref:LysR family transcriptional regulator n=1 Tax=Amaricoccus sp. TaxID=1872485 RepID=UPI001B4BA062|nr:LysR family transcriptional regulator [Amaricoccus sp.]MBP7241103.1 LysR family transcriptional regulator [Amaricoccus sp.]